MGRNENMRKARLFKGLSQEELARQAGISRQTVNMMERGDYNPSVSLALRICWILECTLDDLFWREKEREEA